VKRVLDVVVAGCGLLALLVPFAVIAVGIKLLSPGPVLYRQSRVGRGGRLFSLYKFRTMRTDGHSSLITVEGDSRITPIGQVLRRWKLDELPQLWNVLRGQMSIIGPRPEVERFVRHYSLEQRRILEQTPGLAGMAQLVYPHEAQILSGHADPEEAYLRYLLPRKIAVDLEYEQRRSVWSDFQLLAELLLLVLGKSYRIDHSLRTGEPQSKGPE
jgi:lipopolysaccharide/colanic/teichoic acid biosynthesis glycosyltransferase